MSRGCFVVLEGPEGAGKTTLASGLATRLRGRGVDPVVVRQPGGTPLAEALRREVLESDRRWTPERELLYLVTARAEVVSQVIQPALDAGRLVISDRHDLSTRAYQGVARGLAEEKVDWLLRAANGDLQPDLTLILDLPPEAGTSRLDETGRARNRLDKERIEFHRVVARRYLAEQGPAVRHLDASQPAERVLEQAWAELRNHRPDLVPPA